MLKKENRLTKREFDFVFKNGQKKFSKNFMFLKMENQDSLKISTSVSKKIYKSAVQRNQARRKIYTLIQENFEKLPKNF
jgi:ribonuclease P protein component